MLIPVRRFACAVRVVSLSVAVAYSAGAQATKAKKDTTSKRDSISMKDMPGMAMPDSGRGMAQAMVTVLGIPMDRMGSGTTWIPDAAPLPARHFMAGSWDMMAHGFGFLEENAQLESRGAWQFGSLNWGMLMAAHALSGGQVQPRVMLSLDPATVTNRGYPLLLQTGEAAGGEPLHDRQHPHDFLMEVGVLYERAVTRTLGVELYAAPSGEPALGPVAFMHRPSGMDNPAAPIAHHWQDATHIAFGVLTAGLFTRQWKLEGSAFNGREPDEHRWDIDPIRLDSYSARATFNPTVSWSFTAGYGYLKSPEALEPATSLHRAVSSALYGKKLGADGQWAASLIWGANFRAGSDATHSILLESEAVLNRRSTVFGRAEWAEKSADDLVLDSPPTSFPPSRTFRVGELSVGYIVELKRWGGATLGIGGMATVNAVPRSLERVYGSRTPAGLWLFFRIRPLHSPEMQTMQMPMRQMP